MGLRQAKKDRMRQELYESAVSLFRQKGFDGTRVRDIVELAGASEATFFNYFPTKEAVLHQSAATTKQLYGTFLEHLVERRDEPTVDRLRDLVRGMAWACAGDREFLATVVTRTTLLTGSEGAEREKDLANFDLLAAIFAQGVQRGEIRDRPTPMQLAEIFVAIQSLTITNWAIDWWGDTGTLEGRMLAALDVMVGGCQP